MSDYKFNKVELLLLRLALQSNSGFSLNKLFLSEGISVSDASSSYRSLSKIEFLKKANYTIQITTLGREWVMKNQNLFGFHGEKHWREVPEKYLANSIFPFQPYIPQTKKLSKRKFVVGGDSNF